MTFNDRRYTQDALIKQLGLVELHGKDGSAVDAACKCIQTKHSFNIEGLAEEGIGFALSEKEKQFYAKVADWARDIRKHIETEDYSLGNPFPRQYLPYGLTVCEKQYPSVRRKMSRCIKKLEPRERSGEIESAVAVCRASIPCPP